MLYNAVLTEKNSSCYSKYYETTHKLQTGMIE